MNKITEKILKNVADYFQSTIVLLFSCYIEYLSQIDDNPNPSRQKSPKEEVNFGKIVITDNIYLLKMSVSDVQKLICCS